MLNVLRKRLAKDEEDGFTLIELMVVVLIIAILIAIAIPTFLGARERSQNRGAQSSLRNGLTAAKTFYTDDGDYSGATDTALPDVEPSLSYVATGTASDDKKEVSVSAAANEWAGAVMSDSGTCYLIRDVGSGSGSGLAAPGTYYGETGTATNCTGTYAATDANTAGAEW
jgi:type IV pilus assembly protein PilA